MTDLAKAFLSEETGGMTILGISIRAWSLVVGAPCVLVACIVSVISMLRHCSRNKDKQIRRHLLRILFMVPIYGVNALMALIFPFHVELFTLFREAYEAVTIYSLAQFLFVFLGGEPRLRYLLSLEDQAQDEYHLFRITQNLANPDVISLPNKNFVPEPPQEIISPIDPSFNSNGYNSSISQSDFLANNYRQREYELNRPWYTRLPFVHAFFPAPDFTGKTQFSTLPMNYTPPTDLTFNQQSSKMKKTDGQAAPLLANSHSGHSPARSTPPSLNSSATAALGPLDGSQTIKINGNNATLVDTDTKTIRFLARGQQATISASEEDKESFQRFKKKQKLKQTLRFRQGQGTDSSSIAPTGDSGDGGDPETSLDGLRVISSKEASSQPSESFSLGKSHHAIDMVFSPPDESQVNVTIDQSMPNHLLEPASNQQVLITRTKNGQEKQYLSNLHDSTAYLDASQLEQRIVTLEYHPQLANSHRTYDHMFPLNHMLKPVPADRFLFISKFSILQYVPIQIGCAFIAMIGHMAGVYHPGSWKANNLYPYIAIVLNASQFSALYGLFWFLHVFSANLLPINAMSKALTIKAVVFATFWQSCAIALWYFYFPSCSHDSDIPRRCLKGEWDSEQQAAGINSFLICVEMFIFALIHLKVFSWREFGRPLMYDSSKPVLRSVIEFFSPTDIMSDVKQNISLGNVKQALFPTSTSIPATTSTSKTAHTTTGPTSVTESPSDPFLRQDGDVIKVDFSLNDQSSEPV